MDIRLRVQGAYQSEKPERDAVPFLAVLFEELFGFPVPDGDSDTLTRLWVNIITAFKKGFPVYQSEDSMAHMVLEVLQERAIARRQDLSIPVLPSGVARLMLKLAQVTPGECLLDLCPGPGVLPAEALLTSEKDTVQPCVMAGVFAKQLLQLCGLPADKLLPRPDPAKKEMLSSVRKADVVCSMGGALSAGDSGQREQSLLELHLAYLTPLQGRAILLASPSLLFRQGNLSHLRTALLQRNVLDAILLLPGNAFYGSNAQFALLIFDRGREANGPRSEKKDVFMLDLAAFADSDRQDCFWHQSKNLNYFETHHIQKICELMQQRSDQPGISCHTPCERLIAENIWSPSRFLHDATSYNWRAEKCEYQNLESSLSGISNRLASLLDSLEHDFLKIGEQRKRDDDAAS